MADLTGKSVGRYHIQEPLGQGGMAKVYKAFDTRLEREVAIKFIRMEQVSAAQIEGVLKRFEREAKALGRLNHPNIVGVYDFGEYENSPYLVMEYVPGGTLKARIGGKSIPYTEAASLLLPVARSLAYAHSLNIIHRDVKPANILLTVSGDPMLSDFGVAKILQADDQTLTGTGVGIGTPEYMAPEQWMGKAGASADIYALGVVLYELVTGNKPYTADTPAAILIKQMIEPLPPPGKFVPGLPVQLERVLFKALAKDPAERYLSMNEFGGALEKLLVSQVPAAEGNLTPGQQSRALGSGREDNTLTLAPSPKKRNEVKRPSPFLGQGAGGEVKRKPSFTPWLLGLSALVFICLLSIVGVGLATGGFGLLKTSTRQPTTEAALAASKTSILPDDTATHPTPSQTATFSLALTFTPTISQTATLALTPTLSQTAVQTRTPIPTPKNGATLFSDKDGMVLVYVPEGDFLMGAANSDTRTGIGDEKPQHKVWLDAFWIDRTEVTNALYQKCVEDGVCTAPVVISSYTQNLYYGSSDYANYPVLYVDWNQASTYCSYAGRRLPSEAEWEKAARGTGGRVYPWGNKSPDNSLLNFNKAVGDTTEVGRYPQGASPYGVLDMAGNVWEWVSDWYQSDYYQISPDRNPTGPVSGDFRTLRGGSWNNEARYVVASYRHRNSPVNWTYNIGFRCVR